MSKQLRLSKTLTFAAAWLAASLVASSVYSHDITPRAPVNLAEIDRELNGQIDFRKIDYRVCLGQETCTVNDVTLVAQRRFGVFDLTWKPAEIYWDPIDGIGIMEGAQNDEIDFDERLQVSFADRTVVKKIWFSDLFLGEDERYGSSDTDWIEDVPINDEVAGVGLVVDGAVVSRFNVWSDREMPDSPFNLYVSSLFVENGDLKRRVVINSKTITLVVPDPRKNGHTIRLELPLGQVDDAKVSIFDGVETVEIGLERILAEFHDTSTFAIGSTNFERIEAMLDDPDGLEKLRLHAATDKSLTSWFNGEKSVLLTYIDNVDGLNFFAPFDASNDFSIAGLVLAD